MDELPKVTLYTSDRVWLTVFCVASAGTVISVASQPSTAWGWAQLVAAMSVAVGVPLLSRLIPTQQQAGALRFASEANRQLPEVKMDQIVAAVERKDEAKNNPPPVRP